HALQVSRGENHYVAIPAFVSRLFRHSGIYIRTDRGIQRPQDLKGKALGLPEFQITANVWIRGLLHDEYGVNVRDVHWRSGGVEDSGREERAPLMLARGIDLKLIPKEMTLSALVEAGMLDGMMGARAPNCFVLGVMDGGA